MIIIDPVIEKAQEQLDNGFDEQTDINEFFETVLSDLFVNINAADSSYAGGNFIREHDYTGIDLNLNSLFNDKEPVAYSLGRWHYDNVISYNEDYIAVQTLPFSLRIKPLDREKMRRQFLLEVIAYEDKNAYYDAPPLMAWSKESRKYFKNLLENFVIISEKECDTIKNLIYSDYFDFEEIKDSAFYCLKTNGVELEDICFDISEDREFGPSMIISDKLY
ncbi:MAG: hypothetical protein LBM93_02420, partial [Oscillospiraceae bacterium]|nr:hypothetical protein [Oscillospiraceae bacterium]